MKERQRKDSRPGFVAGGVVILVFLMAVATDAARFGPANVELPPDAMSTYLEIIRISDLDDGHDYFAVALSISNFVNDPSVRPYEATVTLRVNRGSEFFGHGPSAGDHDEVETGSFPELDRTFTFPAGLVTYDESDEQGIATWTVQGERLWKSEPIFGSRGDFLLPTVRVAESATLTVSAEVTVTWYYRSPVQAYPVATRTITAGLVLNASGRLST